MSQDIPLQRSFFAAGDLIFKEGDPGDVAYLIASGQVEILKKDPSGKISNRVALLERGDIFGEMAVIDDKPRMASARVVGDAELTILPKDLMQSKMAQLKKSDPAFWRLMTVLIDRLRHV